MRHVAIVVATGLLIITMGVLALTYDDLMPSRQGEVSFREIAKGTHSIETLRKNYLIASPAEYALLWRMLDGAGTAPEIDFDKESVIATFAGERSTAGYEIRVGRIEDTGVRKVTLVLTKPNENCLTAQAITAPYQVVVVPKTTLTYTHEDEVVTTSCL